jgi:hypothetical protein
MVSPTAVKSVDLRAPLMAQSKAAWWVYWAEIKSAVIILGD